MRRLNQVFWAVSLLLFLSGCSSYRSAILPGLDNPPQNSKAPIVVTKRSNVRVTLKSGKVVSGEVLRVSEKELVFGRPGNFGLEEEAHPAEEIEKIEVEFNSGGDKIVLYSVLGLMTLGTVVMVGFSKGLEEGLGGLN